MNNSLPTDQVLEQTIQTLLLLHQQQHQQHQDEEVEEEEKVSSCNNIIIHGGINKISQLLNVLQATFVISLKSKYRTIGDILASSTKMRKRLLDPGNFSMASYEIISASIWNHKLSCSNGNQSSSLSQPKHAWILPQLMAYFIIEFMNPVLICALRIVAYGSASFGVIMKDLGDIHEAIEVKEDAPTRECQHPHQPSPPPLSSSSCKESTYNVWRLKPALVERIQVIFTNITEDFLAIKYIEIYHIDIT